MKGDDPDNKGSTGPSDLGFGVWAEISKNIYVEKTSNMHRMGLINRRRSGYKGRDLTFRTGKIGIRFETGAAVSIYSPN